MVEKVFKMNSGDESVVEKVIQDDNLHYLHMVFDKDRGLPEHHSNAPVYMTVLRGRLSIRLDEQEAHEYDRGTILQIPFNTKMNVKNTREEPLELIVVKAPPPGSNKPVSDR